MLIAQYNLGKHVRFLYYLFITKKNYSWHNRSRAIIPEPFISSINMTVFSYNLFISDGIFHVMMS